MGQKACPDGFKGSFLKIESHAKARHDGQLVHPLVSDAVKVENIFPVVHVRSTCHDFQARVFPKLELPFEGAIQSVVVGQTATVALAIQDDAKVAIPG